MRAMTRTAIFVLATAVAGFTAQAQSPLPTLKVSPNKRFLLKSDNTPFFYL